MYALIYAESLGNYSTGKTMRVWADVDGISFSIDKDSFEFKIEAQCRDRESSGSRGGDYNPIRRDFELYLEKDEVVKLVETALNAKMLEKIEASNPTRLDRIERLEVDIENLNKRIVMLEAENGDLRRRIASARDALGVSDQPC